MKRFVYALLALAVAIAVALPVQADHCVRVRAAYHAPVYHAPVYHTPVHHQAPQFLYIVDSSERDVRLINAFRDAVVGITQAQRQGAPVPIDPQKIARGEQPPLPPPLRASATGARWRDAPSPYQDVDLLKVVQDSCVRCHGPAKQSGALSLVTSDGKSLADVDALELWVAHDQVYSGEMPKQAKALSDEDAKRFQKWAQAATTQARKRGPAD